jgi:methylated-DNA-[protein]-cysteine S-methyltransferase
VIRFLTLPSPIGPLTIAATDRGLAALYMASEKHGQSASERSTWVRDDTAPGPASPILARCRDQLTAYFQGQLRTFDLPLDPTGTDFQQRVWRELRRIPFGATSTYGALARQLGNPGASRAVGSANGHNPISIVVPCHRVVGSDGSLTGYGGGLERKKWLLAHEARVAGGTLSQFQSA